MKWKSREIHLNGPDAGREFGKYPEPTRAEIRQAIDLENKIRNTSALNRFCRQNPDAHVETIDPGKHWRITPSQ